MNSLISPFHFESIWWEDLHIYRVRTQSASYHRVPPSRVKKVSEIIERHLIVIDDVFVMLLQKIETSGDDTGSVLAVRAVEKRDSL